MKPIRQATLLVNEAHSAARQALAECLGLLERRGVRALAEPRAARLAPKGALKTAALERALAQSQLVLALGGDGTLLRAVQAVAGRGLPLLGIHLGRRGYLSAAPREGMEAVLEQALAGRLRRERRALLEVRVLRAGRERARSLALNDVVLARGATGRLAELEVAVDGEPLTDYLADGLIVATPTGSTAYALSVGGPLLEPSLPALVLAPIAPHSLSHRPLVLPDRCTIQCRQPQGGSGLALSADGRLLARLAPGETLQVCKARESLILLMPKGQGWATALRSKLGWRGH